MSLLGPLTNKERLSSATYLASPSCSASQVENLQASREVPWDAACHSQGTRAQTLSTCRWSCHRTPPSPSRPTSPAKPLLSVEFASSFGHFFVIFHRFWSSIGEEDLSEDHDHMCSKYYLRKSWSWSSSVSFPETNFQRTMTICARRLSWGNLGHGHRLFLSQLGPQTPRVLQWKKFGSGPVAETSAKVGHQKSTWHWVLWKLGCNFVTYNWKLPAYRWWDSLLTIIFGSFFACGRSFVCLQLAFLLKMRKCVW